MQTNNKMREALKELRDIVHDAFWSKDGVVKGDVLNALRRANVALAKPVLNCEVGTAEEQCNRFMIFCSKHENCGLCPAHREKSVTCSCSNECWFVWAQMPYTEGGEE